MGTLDQNLSVLQVQPVTSCSCDLTVFVSDLRYVPHILLKMIRDSPEVLNFNLLFFKLN